MASAKNKYFFEVGGKNYEYFIGSLTNEQFDYWSTQSEFDLGDAFTGLADNHGNSEKASLPGLYLELPTIEHRLGPIVEDSTIIVSDANNNQIFFGCVSDIKASKKLRRDVINIENLDKGCYAEIAIGCKGSFFTAEFTSTSFCPEKISLSILNVNGRNIVSEFFYDGKILQDTGDWSNDSQYVEVCLHEVEGVFERVIASAEAMFDSGDTDEAIRQLNSYVNQNIKLKSCSEQEVLIVQQKIAIFTMYNSKHAKASKLFKENLSKWEDLEGSYGKNYSYTAGLYAANLVQQGRFLAAVPLLQRYLMSFDDASHWNRLAHALENVGRLRESESAYNRAIEAAERQFFDYGKAQSLHGLYRVLKSNKKRQTEALAALKKAIKIARSINNAALLKSMNEDYKKIKR